MHDFPTPEGLLLHSTAVGRCIAAFYNTSRRMRLQTMRAIRRLMLGCLYYFKTVTLLSHERFTLWLRRKNAT